jgi:hypothetical protein
VAIFVDRLGKRLILVPIRDIVTIRDLAQIFIIYIIRHVGLPDSITLDKGL